MKVWMRFKPLQYVILALSAAVGLVAVILNALLLAEAAGFTNATPPVTIVAICCSSAIVLLVVAVFCGSYYEFGEDALKVRFAFVPSVVKYENIVSLRENDVTKKMFLIYKTDKSKNEDGTEGFMFSCAQSKFEKIQQVLQAKGVVFEIFEDE